MTSWKTTLGGLLSGGGLIFAQFFPEWSRWGMFAAALGSVLLGIAARDNGVTSEQSGATAKAAVAAAVAEAREYNAKLKP